MIINLVLNVIIFCLWCGAKLVSIGKTMISAVDVDGLHSLCRMMAFATMEREGTVTAMLEAAVFLVALAVGLCIYAIRDGLSDIKHEIWELRMDLRDKDGDGEDV